MLVAAEAKVPRVLERVADDRVAERVHHGWPKVLLTLQHTTATERQSSGRASDAETNTRGALETVLMKHHRGKS
jgi:hypothetical protein